MTDAALDLDAYLARIGYDGPREATLAVLAGLHVLHPAAIPFENLDPLLGQAPRLGLDALQAKLVYGGRGGYCYEQNGLFRAALEALGFSVTGLAARVLWGAAPDASPRPRSHMALRVDLPQGAYLADVGFGGLVMTAPLALQEGPQDTPHERLRLVSRPGGDWELQAELGDDWSPLLRFDVLPYAPVDYEPLNWFSATRPDSIFVTGLMAARAEPGRRLTLSDTQFTVRRRGELAERRQIASLDELGDVLRNAFGITLPSGWDAIGAKFGL